MSTSHEYETIELSRSDGIARITLNRPSAANAINTAMARDLAHSLSLTESDAECRVLLLTGSGRAFCAGGDVSEMHAAPDQGAYLRDLAGAMGDVVFRLSRSRLIVVAAVHGPSAGAGLGLVLNADLVVASRSASFLAAYGDVGLTPDCGVSFLLPRVVGPRLAADLCLRGRALSAEEARTHGLVTESCEDDELGNRAEDLCRRLASRAGQALAPTKALLRTSDDDAYRRALDREVEAIASMPAHADTRERIAAFATRRTATR